jgi:hypothetical protein
MICMDLNELQHHWLRQPEEFRVVVTQTFLITSKKSEKLIFTIYAYYHGMAIFTVIIAMLLINII